MNRAFFSMVSAGVILMTVAADAASLKAELIMPGGRSWKGTIVGREGDWISFSTGGKPIRIGVDTIDRLVFEVKINKTRLNEMNRDREYGRIIETLERTLKGYAEYSDIPSNLSPYTALLMELYYTMGNYEKSLEISSKIAAEDADPKLQKKSRIYQVLALIDSGRTEKAESLVEQFGWSRKSVGTERPENLYVFAKIMAAKKDYKGAIEQAAKLVALYSQSSEWIQPAELLCAELYADLGMYDSADEVIRQISLLYKDSNENDRAQKLKQRVEVLRAEQELQKTLESE